jgi:hypothetical protein
MSKLMKAMGFKEKEDEDKKGAQEGWARVPSAEWESRSASLNAEDAVLMVASRPLTVDERLTDFEDAQTVQIGSFRSFPTMRQTALSLIKTARRGVAGGHNADKVVPHQPNTKDGADEGVAVP